MGCCNFGNQNGLYVKAVKVWSMATNLQNAKANEKVK
jgi:hypothetical protein